MGPSSGASRDRLTVDLKGLKAALQGRAAARGVPVSVLVRDVLAREVGGEGSAVTAPAPRAARSQRGRVRLSLRLSVLDGHLLLRRSRDAGLPLGEFVMAKVQTPGHVSSAAERTAQIAALTRSTAQLAGMRRDLAQLSAALQRSDLPAATPIRTSLTTLEQAIRAHLEHASALLASPARPRSGDSP